MSSKKLPTFNDDTDDEEAFDVAKTSSKKAAGTSSKKSIPINVTIPSAPPSDEHAPSSPSQQHHDSHAVEIPPTRVPDWLLDHIEYVFKIRQRKTTVEMELFTGVIQFISCVYVLPVVPDQMKRAGYDEVDSIMATTVTCAIGCIIGAFLTDMPFIIAPPTSVSIFFAVSMQQSGFTSKEGNAGLLIAGAALAFLGFVPPVGRFFTKLIPDSIQAAISVGIGLITALAGATEINLVVRGKYTILDMGELTTEIVVAIANLIIVAVMLHYHVKGAFCCGLFVGTLLWWIIDNAWPNSFAAQPETKNSAGDASDPDIVLLVFNLFFLFILTLNGLARSLSDLGGLTKSNGSIPRGKFLFIVTGLTTMLSAYMSGPPVLISPETAAGIKAGARTGLSTLVCGILFGIATFFSPLFASVPPAGTAPLLIMVGVMMFGNGKRIDWANYKVAVPAYCVLFFIPFTYSILRGVAFGYVIYIMIGLFTGDMIDNTLNFIEEYRTQPWFTKQKAKPLSQAEDVDKYDMEDVDLDETAHPAPNLDDGKKRNILQRTMLKINEILDAQDIKGDTNITSTPEQGNMY
eukprot:gene4042-4420_t